MTTKHTPEPWRSGSPARLGAKLWEKLVAADGRIVALVDRPEDASLIVAAPAMRSAIRALLADYGPIGDPVTRKKVGDNARALLARIDGTEATS